MIDPHSETWIAVRNHARDQIHKAHDRLEMKGFPDSEYERGRIKALKDILELVEPKPEFASTDPRY